MPGEKAQELLGLMEEEPAAEAAELLAHAEDSAGGLMTTEYASLPPGLTAAQALDELRKRYAGELDDFHYVYITDEQEHVLGVTSLWDLIRADPAAALLDFAETKVISVRPEHEAEEAARLITKYGILAIPVVDAENRLLGVVTVDDAMDLILPENWRGRLPHMY
jgi:magnesium transporter